MTTAHSLLTTAATQEIPRSLIEWLRQDESPEPQYDFPEAGNGIYDLPQLLIEIEQNPKLNPPIEAVNWLRSKCAQEEEILLWISW